MAVIRGGRSAARGGDAAGDATDKPGMVTAGGGGGGGGNEGGRHCLRVASLLTTHGLRWAGGYHPPLPSSPSATPLPTPPPGHITTMVTPPSLGRPTGGRWAGGRDAPPPRVSLPNGSGGL